MKFAPANRSQVLIVTDTEIFGPFPDLVTAEGWIAAPHAVAKPFKIFSLWSQPQGTYDKAHTCGGVLRRVS